MSSRVTFLNVVDGAILTESRRISEGQFSCLFVDKGRPAGELKQLPTHSQTSKLTEIHLDNQLIKSDLPL